MIGQALWALMHPLLSEGGTYNCPQLRKLPAPVWCTAALHRERGERWIRYTHFVSVSYKLGILRWGWTGQTGSGTGNSYCFLLWFENHVPTVLFDLNALEDQYWHCHGTALNFINVWCLRICFLKVNVFNLTLFSFPSCAVWNVICFVCSYQTLWGRH